MYCLDIENCSLTFVLIMPDTFCFSFLQVSGNELLGGRLSYPLAVGQNDASTAAGGGEGSGGAGGASALPTTLTSEGDGQEAQNLDWELKVSSCGDHFHVY